MGTYISQKVADSTMKIKKSPSGYEDNDPILAMCRDKLKLSDAQIIAINIGFTFICHHILGFLASYTHSGSGERYSNPSNLYFGLAWLLLFTPLIWYFYLRQQEILSQVLKSFEKDDLIGAVIPESKPLVQSFAAFYNLFMQRITLKRWSFLALLPVISFWLYHYLFSWSVKFTEEQTLPFWYAVKWFTPFYILGFSVTFYILWLLALKYIQVFYLFNHLFTWFELKVKPAYPDGVGGLEIFGKLLIQRGMMAIGVGIIALAYGLQIWANTNNLFQADLLVLFAFYLTIIPLSLILPMLGVHNAMERARTKSLEGISKEISAVLANLDPIISSDAATIKATNEKLVALKETYQLLYATFPTWPISFNAARNFSVTAVLPLVSTLFTMLLKKFFPGF